MANYGSVTITDVATKILDANDVYRPLWINTVANNTVFIGDTSAVTTSIGLPIVKNNVPLYGQLEPGQELWGMLVAADPAILAGVRITASRLADTQRGAIGKLTEQGA